MIRVQTGHAAVVFDAEQQIASFSIRQRNNGGY